jgi:anti-sigma factor ChrR (cupin superfamily)
VRGQIFVLANGGEWVELLPGIQMKVLHQDVEHSRTTFLARLAPGASYPSHRHMGLEECLVIDGDLHVDGTVLRSGDFTASYYDKVHIDTHSEEGCLLLISSPMNDEFLDSAARS